MSDLLGLRGAVVASLATKLGASVDVDSHGGTFDLEEVKRFATKAPAVRVAIVGVGRGSRYADGRWRLPVRFSAVVFTRDSATGGGVSPRDSAALLLASAVELAIASNRFGLADAFQPEDVEARSEYSGRVDTLGVALWQVTWSSGILIGNPGDPSDVVIDALTEALVQGEATWNAPAAGVSAATGLTGVDPLNAEDNP